MKTIKNNRNILLLLLLTVAVLYFTLKDSFNEIVDQLVNINIVWLMFAIVLMFSYWILRAYAYFIIIKKVDKNYKFKRVFNLILLTQFFNGITPFASGGQPLVVYTLKKDGIDVSKGTNIIMQDFITYQIALILIGTIAIIYNYNYHIFKEVNLLKEIVAIGYLINVTVVIVLFLVSFGRKSNQYVVNFIIKVLNKLKLIKHKEKLLLKWEDNINNFHDGAKDLFKDYNQFKNLIIINTLALLLFYAIPLFLMFSFRNYESINLLDALVSSAYIMLVGSFIPIPGATGGLEYAFIAFFSNFIKGSIVNSLMLLWRFVTYYFGMILGSIVFNLWKRRV